MNMKITHKIEEDKVYLYESGELCVTIIDEGYMEIIPERKKQSAGFAAYCRRNDISFSKRNPNAKVKTLKPKKDKNSEKGNMPDVDYSRGNIIYPGPFNTTLGVKCPDWLEWCKDKKPKLFNYLKKENRI